MTRLSVILIGLDLVVLAVLLVVLDRVDRHRRSRLRALSLRVDSEYAERRRDRRAVIQGCHDMRNLLAVVRGYAEIVGLRSDDPQIRIDAELMIAQLDRMVLITSDLRRAGPPDSGPGRVDDNRMTTG